jgi:hypothetical protein
MNLPLCPYHGNRYCYPACGVCEKIVIDGYHKFYHPFKGNKIKKTALRKLKKKINKGLII